jgi:hypothetical protein
VLPAVGGALALGTALASLAARRRGLAAAAIVALLVVSQGATWAQVVACRINAGVHEAVRRAGVTRASAVVFDLRSFTDAMPSGIVRFEFEYLSSYYGAQAFTDWGLASMVHLASGHDRTPVHFAVDPVRRREDGSYAFTAGRGNGTRAMTRTPASAPAGAVVIGYRDAGLPAP